MAFPDRLLKQSAVYWGNPQSDGYGGRTFAAPVKLAVRWEDRQEIFLDRSGREQVSRAIVYFVNKTVELDGYMRLGTLEDLSSEEQLTPLSVNDAYPIWNIDVAPSVDADRELRKAWLGR